MSHSLIYNVAKLIYILTVSAVVITTTIEKHRLFCGGYLYGLNASQITDRSVIYKHLFEPLSSYQQFSDVYNFTLVEGYYPSAFSSVEQAKIAYEEKIIGHFCPEAFHALVNVSIQGVNSKSFFNATYFLSLIANKRVFYIGDSLSRQAFLDISSELSPFQSLFRYGDHLQNSTKVTSTKHFNRNNIEKYAQRQYHKFNATITYCEDGQLRGFSATALLRPPCLKDVFLYNRLQTNTILILGPGAWFKPLFNPVLNKDYMIDMELKYRLLFQQAYKARRMIHAHDPQIQVLWKLPVHMGLGDELQFIDPLKQHATRGKAYVDGWVWSNTSHGALWPAYYGQALKYIAQHFNDTYLDSYRVSYLYLRHFEQKFEELRRKKLMLQQVNGANNNSDVAVKQSNSLLRKLSAKHRSNSNDVGHLSKQGQVRVHTDALHYCPGSIFRGEMYLLQAALSAARDQ